MSLIYFDVGANDGRSTNALVEQGHLVLAFEPNPEMIAILKEKSTKHPNLIVSEVAVSDYKGEATFNVCDKFDRGCSSLLELSEKANTEWGGRYDMIPASQITVPVVRLDEYLIWSSIPSVEFFHCDTQGSDLAVLRGLGQYIRRIKAGVVEAAAKPDILYKNQNTQVDTVDFLQKNGFEIERIESNDVGHNEVNIYFKRV
jgi:FkbM family methyltransferase